MQSPTEELNKLVENYRLGLEETCRLLAEERTTDADLGPLRAQVFNVLTVRDHIQRILEAGILCDGETFNHLYESDKKLFNILCKTYGKDFIPPLNMDEWRYVRPETPTNYWWWFNPVKIRRDGDQFVVYDAAPLRLLTIMLVILAVLWLLGTTLQLVADEQVIFATLNFVIQLALGGLLIVPFAFSMQFLGRLGALVCDFTNWIRRGFTPLPPTSSLHQRQSTIAPGLLPLMAAVVFLAFAVGLPRLLTWGANFLYDRAVLAVDGGVNLSAGEFYLDLVNRLNPGNRQAAGKLAQLAVLYQNTGRMDKAVELYERALEYDGRVILALDQLAEYYIDIGDYSRAIQLTDRAIGLLDVYLQDSSQQSLPIDPDTAPPWMYRTLVTRGRARLALGYPENALRDDLRFALTYPDDPRYSRLFVGPSLADNTSIASGAQSTIEAYFRLGVAYVMLTMRPNCEDSYVTDAIHNFEQLGQYPISISKDDSRTQTWQIAAQRAISELRSHTCETLNTAESERDFIWLFQIN